MYDRWRGTSLRLRILIVALAAALSVGGYVLYKRTRPRPVDPRINPNTESVPPPGIAPFDPKPLMERVRQSIITDKFRFAVLGDTKHASTLPAFIKFLEETVNPDFVLGTGDMVYNGGGRVGPGYYELLTHEAGQSMRKRPWWPAVGNHEVAGNPVITGSKTELSQLKANQRTGIDNFKLFYNLDSDYYSFTFRNCYFIALPFRQPEGDQVDWLENELIKANQAKKYIIIFNHVPYFTVGSKGSDDVPNTETNITALFKKYGVIAVFSGHDHGYYRTVRNGIPYFISAGGGAMVYAAKRADEALPEDVYYFGVPQTYKSKLEDHRFILHKNDGTADKITAVQDQFLCVVDVDGDKIICTTLNVKGEKWDEIRLK
jgi:hypothetical protein